MVIGYADHARREISWAKPHERTTGFGLTFSKMLDTLTSKTALVKEPEIINTSLCTYYFLCAMHVDNLCFMITMHEQVRP